MCMYCVILAMQPIFALLAHKEFPSGDNKVDLILSYLISLSIQLILALIPSQKAVQVLNIVKESQSQTPG